MRTNLSRALLVVAVVLAASAPAFAQGIVRGTVVDAQGKGVEGVTVVVESTASGRKMETKTNRNGEFMQVGMATGPVTITATKDKLQATQNATVGQQRPAVVQIQLVQGSAAANDEAKAELTKMVEGAVTALNAGNNDEAIRQFSDIVAKLPSCAECYYNLGVAYSKKGDQGQAEASFLKATEANPSYGDAWAGLANIYNAQKKYDQATAASAKASSLAGSGGGSAESVYNEGVILFNGQKFADAKVKFEQAVKANPSMAMAQYQLGMTALNLGDFPLAVTSLEAYLKIEPNGPKAAEVKTALPALQAMVKK